MYKIQVKKRPYGAPYGPPEAAIPIPDFGTELIQDDRFGTNPRSRWIQSNTPFASANRMRTMGPYSEPIPDMSEVHYQNDGFQKDFKAAANDTHAFQKGKRF